MCLLFNHLNQIRMNDSMSHIIATSIELAMENCQESFKWERWNCPSNSFLSKRNSNQVDREQAFVSALVTASFIYTMAQDCSKDKSSSTMCKSLQSPYTAKSNSKPRDSLAFANFHNERAANIVSLPTDKRFIHVIKFIR